MMIEDTCKLIAAALFALTGAVADAVALPHQAASVGVPNDGYIVLDNFSGESFVTGDRLCPLGSNLSQGGGKPLECVTVDDHVVPPTTAQQALDQKFGAERALVVGYAPMGFTHTVVYFRTVNH